MGLDDLIDGSTEESESKTRDVQADVSVGEGEKGVTHNTSPSTKCLPETKECPNCGEESGLFDDVWECKNSWCRIDFFVTEEGLFTPSVEEDDGFLEGYLV